jgi:hypothetical protein
MWFEGGLYADMPSYTGNFPTENYVNLSPRLYRRRAVFEMSQLCAEGGELSRSVRHFFCQNYRLIHIFFILILLFYLHLLPTR